jgi:integrase/recombinase XerD
MSGLRQEADAYLTMRRAVGYKLRQDARMLASFVTYMEEHESTSGSDQITIEAALAWATEPSQGSIRWWSARLSVVRGFAKYLKAIRGDTQVPPTDLLPRAQTRSLPYLFSEQEITALMEAARALADPLRAATFETLIGLMACTGLRTGEAMNLDRGDVDLVDGVLLVRDSKFGKSRLVPLHSSTTTALTEYAHRRDRLCPYPATDGFLLSGMGTRLNHTNTSTTFAKLLHAAGLATPAGRPRPRPYDLRH